MNVLILTKSVFVVPFMLWWGLPFWIIGPSILLFFTSLYLMADCAYYKDDYWTGFYKPSFVFLMIAVLLISVSVGYTSKVEGFLSSFLAGFKYFFSFASLYTFAGIILLLPLWALTVQRFRRINKKLLKNFIEAALSATELKEKNKDQWSSQALTFKTFLSKEEKDIVSECDGMQDGKMLPFLLPMWSEWSHFKGVRSFDPLRNKDVIASLVFNWPQHLIVEFFGEFFLNIPNYVIKLLRRPLNFISNSASKGLPDELK